LLETVLNVVWPNTIVFVSKHADGKGGIATLISPNIASVVVGWGTNPTHQLVWKLQILDGRMLGLAHIYTSNNVKERGILELEGH
jgi:hypothetical protein